MKMGIKEFRERLGKIARGGETVQLTDRGQVIGTYQPVDGRRLKPDQFDDWLAARERFRARWQAANPDWREQLNSMGWDEDGEPYENDPRR